MKKKTATITKVDTANKTITLHGDTHDVTISNNSLINGTVTNQPIFYNWSNPPLRSVVEACREDPNYKNALLKEILAIDFYLDLNKALGIK